MIQLVTHIRIRNTESQGTESIIEVLLSTGETRPIKTMIEYLEIGGQYYYFDSAGRVTYIESVHPLYKGAYIRSCNYDGVYDNLMSLPHF